MDPKKMENKCAEVSSMLKAIAHPQRLMILCHLAEGEKNVSELLEVCDVSQSQLSQFLNRMQREKLLHSRKKEQFVYYKLASKELSKLLQSMQRIFCET